MPLKGTVKSKADVERLFREGRRFSSRSLSILALPTPQGKGESGRCAFVAGKKLGCAPVRNRCKRVMRQAAADAGAPWPGYDVVFIAKKSTATSHHSGVVADVKKGAMRLGVCGE